MSKKKAIPPKIEALEGLAEVLGPTDAVAKTPWSEQKERAIRQAARAGFNVERILFGASLEDQVSCYINQVVEIVERQPTFKNVNILEAVRDCLARRLSGFFREDCVLKDDCLELALSFLYLFPTLCETLDRTLSVRELKALDVEELLSHRRRHRHT